MFVYQYDLICRLHSDAFLSARIYCLVPLTRLFDPPTLPFIAQYFESHRPWSTSKVTIDRRERRFYRCQSDRLFSQGARTSRLLCHSVAARRRRPMRPRGVGGRAPPATPMSERQQMALLMQMTTQSSQATPQTAGGAASTTQAGAGGRSPSSRSRDRNERGETPLHLAAIKGDADQVGRLLSHRTDPNVTDFAGWTPLHEACNRGWFEVAFRLVRAGADVNACGFENDTPLHDAAGNGHERIVRMLVERGADVKAKNSKGQTPADVAKPNVVAILKNAAANPPQRDSGSSQRVTGRGARDDTKKSDAKKCPPSPCEPAAESSAAGTAKNAAGTTGAAAQSTADDVYEFKSVKETSNSPDPKTSSTDPLEIPTDDAVDPLSIPASQNQLEDMTPASTVPKRPFAELSDPLEDTSGAAASGTADDETRRKKRKDSSDSTATAGAGSTKEPKTAVQAGGRGSAGPGKTASGKPGSSGSNKSSAASKSPCPSPKPAAGNNGGAGNNDADNDDRSDLKVPPLKIVIPQGNSSEREETSGARNGKSGAQRSHQALPYVVASSNSNDSSASAADKDGPGSGTASPTDNTKGDDKKDSSGVSGDDQRSTSGHHQRVLRSSNRSGPALTTGQDHAGSNPSPQLSQRSHSPSPSVSPAAPAAAVTTQVSSDGQTAPVSTAQTGTTSAKPSVASEAQTTNTTDSTETTSTTTLTTSTTTNTSTTVAPVELHPRKRKLRPSKEQPAASTAQAPAIDTPASGTTGNTGVHPHEQPITNCYQLFLNIRKQIERRRKSLFPVQPKPPQGFKDYLMNRCTYVLAHNAPTQPAIVPPASVPTAMREIYIEQEKERYKLRMQHVIEKEKLVLSVEQEILRVHGLAARTLANQALPFSVCTVLRDEEVYNVITPEQEEKDRNARSRYNGRLFLSWLQDVDDKWEKIKESMLLRHHNEAESLHAVQRMDWEWKLKELSLCEYKATPTIDDLHVPMVHVSDDFDLLPA